jgi:hypothetical protein
VRVVCLACKTEHDNEIHYGKDERYPDDFSIDCGYCDNWEDGSFPMQTFTLVKRYEEEPNEDRKDEYLKTGI